MNATRILHTFGQSLWLDNITRSLLKTGKLRRYVDEFSVAGLTSNPTIFDHAINSGDYDDAIRSKLGQGKSGEKLFIELALEDLKQAGDLFRPIAEPHNLGRGWVGFDFAAGFGCPVKVVNDAAMLALGSYRGGKSFWAWERGLDRP